MLVDMQTKRENNILTCLRTGGVEGVDTCCTVRFGFGLVLFVTTGLPTVYIFCCCVLLLCRMAAVFSSMDGGNETIIPCVIVMLGAAWPFKPEDEELKLWSNEDEEVCCCCCCLDELEKVLGETVAPACLSDLLFVLIMRYSFVLLLLMLGSLDLGLRLTTLASFTLIMCVCCAGWLTDRVMFGGGGVLVVTEKPSRSVETSEDCRRLEFVM